MTVYFQTKSFAKSLRELRKVYGPRHGAVKEISAVLYAVGQGEEEPLRVVKKTKHGETRIPKCVKYDLHGFFRLVTIQDGGAVLFVFVGNHDDEEKWLSSNRGLIVGVDDRQSMGSTKASSDIPDMNLANDRDGGSGPLIKRLSNEGRTALLGKLSYGAVEPIQELTTGAEESEIKASLALIEEADLKIAILDVLTLLNGGDIEGAERRVKLHTGEFKSLGALTNEELIEIQSGTEVKKIPIGSIEYTNWVNSFIHSENLFEWFLFMHPEQENYVQAEYNGPARLSGVSGSGKTAVAIKRALRLSEKYKNEKILIITINKALAELINDIANDALGEKNAQNMIEVKSFADLAFELVHEFEPHNKNLYTDVTIGLEEHKDEVYREFYRCMNNNYDAGILNETHFHLTSQGIDAENYIAEEFDWIRSTRFKKERNDYLTIERKGRSFPLQKNHRLNILSALEAWEQKMIDVGVIDNLGLTTVIGKYLDKINPRYRSIIVDEAQDFGTTELAIIRRLVKEQENDIFVCGDAAQQVQPKRQNFTRSGINIANRSYKLQKNYRNSKEILSVAHDILMNNLSVEHLDNSELEISDPIFAVRSSHEPVLLTSQTIEEEIAFAIQIAKENVDAARARNENHTACIALAGYSQYEVEKFGQKHKINVLNGDRKKFDGSLFLSDLEQTKGYEFDTVVIVNCNDGILPPRGVPEQELYRFVSQFYVAMTRAKTNLILSASGSPSHWLLNNAVNLPVMPWEDIVDPEEIEMIGRPSYLPDFPGEDYETLSELTGEQFVYTEHARGLSVDLLKKICSTSPNSGSPLSYGYTAPNYCKNIGILYDLITSSQQNITKSFFTETEGRTFASAYLNSPLRTGSSEQKNIIATHQEPVKQTLTIKKEKTKLPSIQNEVDKANDLKTLKVPASTYALLFSLNLRTLEDVIKADSQKLRDSLTSKKIREIKKLAKDQLSMNMVKYQIPITSIETSVRIIDAGFSLRTHNILKEMGVTFVNDLSKVSIKDLRKNPRLGQANLLEIQRIAKSFGVYLRD